MCPGMVSWLRNPVLNIVFSTCFWKMTTPEGVCVCALGGVGCSVGWGAERERGAREIHAEHSQQRGFVRTWVQ